MSENSSDNPADKAKQDALYEDREPKKIIRVITVTAYMVSVSFVGIVLSAYYIFLWHPPNPRLMHAQAMASHSEARVDFLVGVHDVASSTGPPLSRMLQAPQALDVFAAAAAQDKLDPGADALKIRREIVENVNAILRASFEKNRSSSEPSTGSQDVTGTPAPDASESSSASGEPSTSGRTNKTAGTSPLTTEESSTVVAATTKRPSVKSSGKKQHQTPFALKHLEVPIKSDGSKRRPFRLTTASSTISSSQLSTNTEAGTSPLGPSSTESSTSYDSSPELLMRSSLYRVLTTPPSQRDTDYPSSTDLPFMPSISSEQFQAVPRANDEEYRDSTIEPGQDDLMDE